MLQLPEQIKVVSREGNKGIFEISPLTAGFGATIANPLRRVLLSSLEGAAITSVKIKGADHQFSSLDGVLEDVIEIIQNVKKIRFKLIGEGPVKLTLEAKGEGEIKASDIKLTSDVELINEDQHIVTITDKKAGFVMELDIEKGIGYVPVEQRQKDKLAIGVISVDAIFSPVKQVNFKIENTRVGQKIDYNKITMEVETDGSVMPEEAVKKAAEILVDHFKLVSEIDVPETKAKAPKKEIGWFPVELTGEGKADPLFKGLSGSFEVFQWHGDTFEIPKSGKHLAESRDCPHQALKVGPCAYGLQFHIEVTEKIIRDWVNADFSNPNGSLKKEALDMINRYPKAKQKFNDDAEMIYKNFLKVIQKRKIPV